MAWGKGSLVRLADFTVPRARESNLAIHFRQDWLRAEGTVASVGGPACHRSSLCCLVSDCPLKARGVERVAGCLPPW